MISTELSLEVSNNTNLKVIRLYDTSFYYNNQAVENYLVEVLPVNKTTWIVFNVDKHFQLVLNSSNLHYKKVDKAEDLLDLPDGIYEIKQSIKPNLKTLNHFYHFRIIEILNRLQKERDTLFNDKCDISKTEFIINRDRLRDIEEYLLAAKWKVEECHDKVKGKEMYEFARKLLEKYSNECQC